MTVYKLVLFVHIFAAVIAFGAWFVYPLAFAGLRAVGQGQAAFFHRLQVKIGTRLMTPAATVLLLAGIYLAMKGPYKFEQPWVGASFMILFVLLGLFGAYFAPKQRKLAALAERDAQSGDDAPKSDEYRRLFAQVTNMTFVVAGLVVVALFLMVTKPGM